MLTDRLREILFPALVVAIIGSLWVSGRVGEMEADIRLGLAPPREWKAMRARLVAEAEADARAEALAAPRNAALDATAAAH